MSSFMLPSLWYSCGPDLLPLYCMSLSQTSSVNSSPFSPYPVWLIFSGPCKLTCLQGITHRNLDPDPFTPPSRRSPEGDYAEDDEWLNEELWFLSLLHQQAKYCSSSTSSWEFLIQPITTSLCVISVYNIFSLTCATKAHRDTTAAAGCLYQSRPNSRLFVSVLMNSVCFQRHSLLFSSTVGL